MKKSFVILIFVAFLMGINGFAKAANYYVSTGGNDDNLGTEGEPWQTITYAATKLQAGDIVHIRGGDYGHEHVVISNSGTEESPIIFEGYEGIPKLDGDDQTGYGVYINSKSYIVLRNFELKNYAKGVRAQNCNYITIDNLTINHMGTESPWTGQGVSFAEVTYSTVTNCNVGHCTVHDLYFWGGGYNLIENCNLYIDTGEELSADYGVYTGESHDNIFRNCIIDNRKVLVAGHHGHGIALRSTSYNNKIIDCVSYGLLEHWVVGEDGYNNEFTNCTAYDSGAYAQLDLYTNALVSRMGAHDNKFISCKSIGVRQGISLWTDSSTIQQKNTYRNCVVAGAQFAIYLDKAENNYIENCIVINSDYLFIVKDETNNFFKNSIIANVSNKFYGGGVWEEPTVAITYCDLWNNGFTLPFNLGNINKDPLFVDVENGDFYLKSQYGRWNGSAWINDSVTSPCIDAGDPDSDYSNEPLANGGRINMGVYGNMIWASKSYVSDDIPPVLFITAPLERVKVFKKVTIKAVVSDNYGVSTVEFYINDILVQTFYNPPYEWVWDTGEISAGEYTIKAVACDTNDNSSEKEITVKVIKVEGIVTYPNPYIGDKGYSERISFANLPNEATIRIHTVAGKLIKTIKHKDIADGGSEEWDISGISSGIYLYTIISPEGKKTGKVSIVK